MRFNYKKISAVLTSALLTGMTMGVAAAAAFPNDFTSQLPAIVYGASADPMDSTQATAISNYLSNKVPSTGTDVTGGDSVKIEKSSTKFQISYGVDDVITTAITDNSPGNGLPNLLADGKFVDNDNDEFDYKQKIELTNWSLTLFDDNDYKDDAPTVGVKIANGGQILNYTLEFTDKPCWEDLSTADLPIMNKMYYVLSITNGTTLNLLDSASGTTTISEGETKTITVGGKAYEVGINFIGSSSVKLDINGETTNTLAATETQRLSDGAYLGVKEINTQDYAGGIKTVQFAIGKGKLKLVHGNDAELNDESITGLRVTLTNGGQSACTTQFTELQKVNLKWSADGDLFVAPDSSPIMPGFESIKLSTTGMKYATEEKIRVKASSSTTIALEDFPLKDSVEDINILYKFNNTGFGWGNISDTSIGKDKDNQLMTATINNMQWNGSHSEYFVASWSDGSSGESYLMRATGWGTSSGASTVDFEYKKDGVWTKAEDDAVVNDVITLGNMEFTLIYLNQTLQVANITTGTNVNFSTLYSKSGAKVYLPWMDLNNYTGNATEGGNRYGALWPTNVTSVIRPWNLTISEEDKNENIAKGGNVTVEIGLNGQSTPEVHTSNILYYAIGGDDSASAAEIGSTDVFRNFLYSELATETLWDKSGDQYFVDAVYHGEEAYAEIFLTDSSAAIGNVGNMVFKDSEQDSWKAKNVIIVGGSCINTAAATALGVSQGTCSNAWETATGIGAGKYLIQSVADKFTTGKIALVVAGYEKADTAAAASKLINQPASIDTTAGNKYVGVVGVEGSSTISKVV